MGWVLGMAGLVVLVLLITWYVYGRTPSGPDQAPRRGSLLQDHLITPPNMAQSAAFVIAAQR